MQPTSDRSLADPILRLIDGLCEVFERGWQSGAPPELERLVVSVPAEARRVLFAALLRLELDFRKKQGRPLVSEEAALRFAGLGDWVDPILAELGLEPLGAHLVLRVISGPHAGELFRLRGHN